MAALNLVIRTSEPPPGPDRVKWSNIDRQKLKSTNRYRANYMKGLCPKVMCRSSLVLNSGEKSEFYKLLDIICRFFENLSAELTLGFITLCYFYIV